MTFFKKIFDFYIECSIHVALAVIALFQMTLVQRNIPTNWSVCLFIFFGTVMGYNSLKYFHLFRLGVFSIKQNFSIFFITFFSFFLALFFFQKFEFSIQIQFIQILFLVLLYPVIRKIWFLKMVYVSLCLTFITAVIPVSGNTFDLLYFVQRFLMIFCLLIPLEIGDLKSDSKTIKTIPTVIGIVNLKLIGYIFTITIFGISSTIVQLLISLVLAIVIIISNKEQSKYFSSFWMDLLPIFFYLLIFYLE